MTDHLESLLSEVRRLADIEPVDVKQIVFGDEFVDEAVQVFENEYRRVLPRRAADYAEHKDAVRSAIEAVLVWSLDLEPRQEGR